MPRKLQLTFQKGASGRVGRWKKFYRGKNYYVGSGRCKSDTESYREALVAWQKLRIELDAAAVPEPRPHAEAYDEVIREWELVLSWAVQHGDEQEATLARDKLAELRERRERKKPPPVISTDRLWSRFRVSPELLQEIGDLAEDSSISMEKFHTAMLKRADVVNSRSPTPDIAIDDVNPTRRAEIQWQDRIASQKRASSEDDDSTIGAWVNAFLARQQQRVDAEDLSPGRFASTQAALNHFREWMGSATDVRSVSGQTLTRFHAHQLSLISAKECAPGYSRDRMSTVRSFVRWLWGQEAIENLPKNIDSNELKIVKRTTVPETFSIEEIGKLLKTAADRTRLYILLGLNCGMTQKDISDLRRVAADNLPDNCSL